MEDYTLHIVVAICLFFVCCFYLFVCTSSASRKKKKDIYLQRNNTYEEVGKHLKDIEEVKKYKKDDGNLYTLPYQKKSVYIKDEYYETLNIREESLYCDSSNIVSSPVIRTYIATDGTGRTKPINLVVKTNDDVEYEISEYDAVYEVSDGGYEIQPYQMKGENKNLNSRYEVFEPDDKNGYEVCIDVASPKKKKVHAVTDLPRNSENVKKKTQLFEGLKSEKENTKLSQAKMIFSHVG